MAKYKITKTDEYYTYELPAHNECKLTRLHDPADVEGGKLILSRSHFLPAGAGSKENWRVLADGNEMNCDRNRNVRSGQINSVKNHGGYRIFLCR